MNYSNSRFSKESPCITPYIAQRIKPFHTLYCLIDTSLLTLSVGQMISTCSHTLLFRRYRPAHNPCLEVKNLLTPYYSRRYPPAHTLYCWTDINLLIYLLLFRWYQPAHTLYCSDETNCSTVEKISTCSHCLFLKRYPPAHTILEKISTYSHILCCSDDNNRLTPCIVEKI